MSISPQNSDKIFLAPTEAIWLEISKYFFLYIFFSLSKKYLIIRKYSQRRMMIVSWVSFVCSKLARLEREEEAAFSLESWAQVRSLVNTRAGETDAFLTWYPGFINISSEWITLQTIILQHYIHSPHYSVIIPHDNPVIQYHSLSLDLSVI